LPENTTSYRDVRSKSDLINKASIHWKRVSEEQGLDMLSS